MHDDLVSAALDLSVLSRADRQAILSALQPAERRRVDAAMRGAPPPAPTFTPIHSGWFNGLVDRTDVTPAARAALVAGSTLEPAPGQRTTGRSLMQAAGGLLRR